MANRISTRGRVTIPAGLRRQVGLQAGTVISFERRADGIMLRKGDTLEESPVDRLFGVLALSAPVDDLLDAMRGPRPRP